MWHPRRSPPANLLALEALRGLQSFFAGSADFADFATGSLLRDSSALSFWPRGVVELDEPLEGFGQAELVLWRDLRLTRLHPLVAADEQRFGLGVLLLAEQAAAELTAGVEGGPVVGFVLLADGQALAEERLGLGGPATVSGGGDRARPDYRPGSGRRPRGTRGTEPRTSRGAVSASAQRSCDSRACARLKMIFSRVGWLGGNARRAAGRSCFHRRTASAVRPALR